MVEVLFQTTGHVLTTGTGPIIIIAFGNVSLESNIPYVHERTRVYCTTLRNRKDGRRGCNRVDGNRPSEVPGQRATHPQNLFEVAVYIDNREPVRRFDEVAHSLSEKHSTSEMPSFTMY